MWIDPEFCGLVKAVQSAPGRGLGAKILNWDGTRFDFAGSACHLPGLPRRNGQTFHAEPVFQ